VYWCALTYEDKDYIGPGKVYKTSSLVGEVSETEHYSWVRCFEELYGLFDVVWGDEQKCTLLIICSYDLRTRCQTRAQRNYFLEISIERQSRETCRVRVAVANEALSLEYTVDHKDCTATTHRWSVLQTLTGLLCLLSLDIDIAVVFALFIGCLLKCLLITNIQHYL